MTSLPKFSVNNPVLVNLFMVAVIFGKLLKVSQPASNDTHLSWI